MNDTTNSRRAAAHGRLANGLGWFSIGLGIAELAMPRTIARLCGVKQHPTLVRLYGVREIATGLGILKSQDAAPWLWARVGGDVLDMATVTGDRSRRATMLRTGATLANLATVAAVDVYAANAYRRPPRHRGVDYPDYTDRSGFPRPADEMRGKARTTPA
ncbi:hypothetical protein CAL26_13105 [Bordetella genomosp. 9]|uniref:Cyclase dehydrase n=1 Tax=Bordetella genomosp. 9 TaxID=1416803 RepID=A0A261R0U0_9BORD|nr:hypothetical protein [Bordetella genomosp. 9]OZI18644.1 hypothetical protein CAL26_13105 [Bordetella genomosp. 9]